jgi:hypothetical protein
MRVLETRYDLRLALESADEVRMVRELGMDGLDRDLAADLRLRGAVDDAERPPRRSARATGIRGAPSP